MYNYGGFASLYRGDQASLVAQMVKNPLLAMQETQVRSLNQEDPLEKEISTNSNILAWKIPWAEKLGGLCPWALKESDMTKHARPHQEPTRHCKAISPQLKINFKKGKWNPRDLWSTNPWGSSQPAQEAWHHPVHASSSGDQSHDP